MSLSLRGHASLAACIVLNSGQVASAALPPLAIDTALLSGTELNAPADAGSGNSSPVGAGDTPSHKQLATRKPEAASLSDPRTQIAADQITGTSDTETRAEGNVTLKKLDINLSADRVSHRQAGDEVEASGNVVFTRPHQQIRGPHLRLKLTENLGAFENPQYQMTSTRKRRVAPGGPNEPDPTAHGSASRMEFTGPGKYELSDATYSTCKPAANGESDWFARAGSIRFDQDEDRGVSRDATVYFKGVPIFYTPWLAFSLSNQRQSGLLTPTIGSTSKSGLEYTQPIYWNIAPDMDATLSPRLMTKRGLQANTEFRYIDPKYSGQARYEYLPDDKVTGTSRHAFALTHAHRFSDDLTANVSVNGVSDDTYFSDLSSRLAVTSQTNLLRQASITYGSTWWSATLMAQTFQTLQDPALPTVAKPYKLLPKFSLSAVRADLPFEAVFSMQTEGVAFRHATLLEGNRFTAYPQIALPLQFSALSVTPKVGLHATKYSLDNPPLATAPASQTRTLPIVSVDSTMVFDRDIQWSSKSLIQTLEPRLYYVYIPNRDQSKIPVFDTGIADLNFSQMFSENRYAGGDRIGDADQVTAMLSSRLIDPRDGTEILRGSFGQRIYFTTQRVGLPGEVLRTNRQTDLLAEVSGQVLPFTTASAAWQYNPRLSKTERFNIGARYQPGLGKVLNVSYRYTHAPTGSVQPGVSQLDVSGQWPLAGKWQAVGRYNYSFEEKRVVETLAGVEYGEDCWAARFVVQRLATQTQTSTTAIFLQLELNGFSRIGSNPLETLKRSIPGYGIINQPSADPAFAAN
jgi:LPS-assembly protein